MKAIKEGKSMRIYCAQLYKLIRNPLFYAAMIVTALLCATKWLPGKYALTGADVYYEIGELLDLATVRKMIAILGAVPFAANFADEWTSRITVGCVSRCGVNRYAVSNVVICFVSSLVTVFLGTMLYAVGLSFFKPVFVEVGNPLNLLGETLLRGGAPWVYIMYRLFVFAASCAMWSVMGMMLTSFFPNKFVGICTPFVASYVIERISMQFPPSFNLWYVSMGYLGWDNIWWQFIYSVALFAAIAVVCGVVFAIMVKRRVQNEVV